jgi:hypothetical protein
MNLNPFTVDLFKVMLHELGHGHLLNHVNDTSAIMYYAQFDDAEPAAARKIYVAYDLSAIYGGQDVMNHSDTLNLSCPYVSQVQYKNMLYCRSPLEVDEINSITSEVKVYPNPATEFLKINFSSSKFGDATISIYNIFGQEIKKQKVKIEKGTTEIEMPIDNLSEGMYFCNLIIDSKRSSLKFIKQ